MPIEIRPARPEDAAAACAILHRSITELCQADYGDDPGFLNTWLADKTIANVTEWISNPDNLFYVALKARVVVGVACMNRSGMIKLNYVSPDARFNGVSRALMQQLESDAIKLGLAQCQLQSTKTARRFYVSAGYREVAAACTTNPCAVMTKSLASRQSPLNQL